MNDAKFVAAYSEKSSAIALFRKDQYGIQATPKILIVHFQVFRQEYCVNLIYFYPLTIFRQEITLILVACLLTAPILFAEPVERIRKKSQ